MSVTKPEIEIHSAPQDIKLTDNDRINELVR